MNWKQQKKTELEPKSITNYQQKLEVAKKIASMVNDGDVIGFGSGSTSALAIQEIYFRIEKENLKISAIPTSHEIEMLCASYGIPTITLLQARPDWCFDGADEIDSSGNLIKGRGGAMRREKYVMQCTPRNRRYILADKSKLVERLCTAFSIPIEVDPEMINYVRQELSSIGAKSIELRMAKGKDGPIITESGSVIIDCLFEDVDKTMESKIKNITGVVESGLFWDYDVKLIIAQEP